MTNARRMPAARASASRSAAPGDCPAADVDDAVQVQHRQVVGVGQRIAPRRPASARRPLSSSPYDAPMDSSPVAGPPSVGRPLRLHALPRVASDAWPGRGPGHRSTVRATLPRRRPSAWSAGDATDSSSRDPAPSLYVHEYTAAGLTVRGLVGALDLSRRAANADDRAVRPSRGHPPRAGDGPRRPDEHLGAEPGPDPARPPRTRSGPRPRRPHRGVLRRSTSSSTAPTSGTVSGPSATPPMSTS